MNLRLVGRSAILISVLFIVYLGLRLFAARPAGKDAVRATVMPPAWLRQRQASTGQQNPRQVVAGTTQEIAANPFDRSTRYLANMESKLFRLSITDTQTGQIIPLGDENGLANFEAQSDDYVLWNFFCKPHCPVFHSGLYAYNFQTQQNRLLTPSPVSPGHVVVSGDWVAYARRVDPRSKQGDLFATNLKTQEIITLSHTIWFDDPDLTHGIGKHLVAWYHYDYKPPATIKVYDLELHQIIASIDPSVIKSQGVSPKHIGVGDTVVTWGLEYAYDIVTSSYFTFSLMPPHWVPQPIEEVSAPTEQARRLYWTFEMPDRSKRHFSAPILDAAPSAAPCNEGQDLVQNGNLEDIAAHNLWQQTGSPSDLIVNDLPPNSAQAGQWAIRLGRYSNSQQTIQQTLNIPANVKRITLAFDVRARSWDIWGGDRLRVDLVDPITNQSVLATPVVWTNRQLANGGWLPLQVDIPDWPGIDTPLQLVFRATTDWALPTDFTLDNIRFVTACQ